MSCFLGDRRARLPTLALVPLLAGGWGWGDSPAELPYDDTGRAAPGPAQPPPPDPERPEPPDPFAEPPPRDPDETPFMPAPNNQLGRWSVGRERPLTRGFDDDHWVQLCAAPSYAALHVPFIGRGGGPIRGGGFELDLDVRVVRWLFIRAYGSHTLHPVFEESAYDEEENRVDLLARGGLVQVTDTGLAMVYALDIGRFVPRVDVGGGLLFVRSPPAAQEGQWGGECRSGGVCDLGLSCAADDVCRPTPFPEVHAGIALDVLFGRRWAAGASVRYYALLAAVSELPIYLVASVRLSARF